VFECIQTTDSWDDGGLTADSADVLEVVAIVNVFSDVAVLKQFGNSRACTIVLIQDWHAPCD